MEDRLLSMVFEHSRWEKAVEKGCMKDINPTILRWVCNPQTRLDFYYRVINGKYEVNVFHIAEIPKDDGTMREVYVAEPFDRIFLSIVNDVLMELFRDTMISKHCRSCLSGTGCQEIVQDTSKEIVRLNKQLPNKEVILKVDLRKYFDTVKIEYIDAVFDRIEMELGFEIRTEPIINVLRKLYHRNLVFTKDNELIEHYGSLMQGCSISGFLADVILYEVDELMAKEFKYFVRYSDDMLVVDSDIDKAKAILDRELPKYGVQLHPKKCERHTANDFVTFLGFKIRGSQITLSKNRVKKLQKEIVSRTLNKPNITERQAKQNVLKFLYGNADGFSWATACLGTVNIEADLIEIDNFIKDCIRACKIRETQKRKSKISIADLGGLGSVDDLDNRTILRGKGSKVRTYKDRTDKTIQNYKTMNCLSKAYKMNVNIYESIVRGI
jgi:hypothetical protein